MKLIFSIIILLIPGFLFAQSFFPIQKTRLLDSIAIQDVSANAPGIATAIVQDGKLVYEKYAGYADLAIQGLISKTTRFNIASNGKQFTALAILSLAEEKKLKLTDDIRKYYPALFPELKEKITIQSLLNHTSGIRDCYDIWNLQGYTWWEKSFSNKDVLKLVEQQQELNFNPGSSYLYSNTNYILLALIIEKVSGKSFVEYTNAMFKKLNMPNTSFENDHSKIRGQIARAYFNFGSWTTYEWIWNVCGDGNIFSTLEDQVQWEILVQGKGQTNFSRSIIAKSQQLIEGTAFRNYGYGLEFGKYKNMEYVFHEGATGAWKATIIRFPSKKTSFITLTNTGKSIPSMQTRQMADVVFNLDASNTYLITKPAKTGSFVSDDDIIGTYLTENDFAFQFEKRDDKMYLKRSGRNDVELEREADNIYHQKYDPLFKQEFTRNNNGALQVTAYYIDHAPYSLTKQSADFSGFDFRSINGTFINTETGVSIEIKHISNKTYNVIFINNKDTLTALLVTPEKLLVNNYTFNFGDSKEGTTIFYLNGDRVKRIRFVRK